MSDPTPARSPRRARWATPDDNQGLIELVRACPMAGSIEMFFDRGPDFYALSRLQGAGAQVCVIDEDASGRLAASGALASFPAMYVDGAVRQASYACDLKVRPERRKGLVVKRVYDFLTAWGLEQGLDLGFTTVMAGNDAMAPILAGKGGLVPYRHVATMRNFTVQFLWPKVRPRGVSVRRATPADVPEMVALWNRLQAAKQFAPAWDEAGFRAKLDAAPGLSLDGYYLAHRGDRLVGLLATWNQEAFKRMVVLGFAPEMLRMRRWYNPLARLTGLTPIPDVGFPLPYFYATELCAETPEDLRALLVHIHNAFRGPHCLFFNAMLDVKDPLIAALDGFLTQAVDIELFAMDPHGRYGALRPGPAYFDPALA